MSKKVFNLSDFDSRACDIEVRMGDSVRTIPLRKFNLMDRLWVEREFGSVHKWETTLFPQDTNYKEAEWLEAVLKTVFRLIEDHAKEDFQDWEDFAETLESTLEVITGLQKALLYVLHGSEPLIERLDEEVKKNLNKPMKKTAKKKKKARTGRR